MRFWCTKFATFRSDRSQIWYTFQDEECPFFLDQMLSHHGNPKVHCWRHHCEVLFELAMDDWLLLGCGVRLLQMLPDFKLGLALQPTAVSSKSSQTRRSSRRRAQAYAQPPLDARCLNIHTISPPFLQNHLQQITSQPRLAPHSVPARNASSSDTVPFACFAGPASRHHPRQICSPGRAAQLLDPCVRNSTPSFACAAGQAARTCGLRVLYFCA